MWGALRRRDRASLGGWQGAAVGRHRPGHPRPLARLVHVQLSELDPAAGRRRGRHREGARAVRVRHHLRRLVGPPRARRREGHRAALGGALRPRTRRRAAVALGPRASITGVFFLNGLCFSAWYARVPAIQQQLDLSPGELGIALFGAPAGLLAAQPLAGALTVRHGSRPLVAAAPLYGIAVVLPALANDMATLLLALIVVGAANGVLDIAMNTQGVAVEAAGIDPLPHLAVDGAVSGALAVLLARGLVREVGGPEGRRFARPSR